MALIQNCFQRLGHQTFQTKSLSKRWNTFKLHGYCSIARPTCVWTKFVGRAFPAWAGRSLVLLRVTMRCSQDCSTVVSSKRTPPAEGTHGFPRNTTDCDIRFAKCVPLAGKGPLAFQIESDQIANFAFAPSSFSHFSRRFCTAAFSSTPVMTRDNHQQAAIIASHIATEASAPAAAAEHLEQFTEHASEYSMHSELSE